MEIMWSQQNKRGKKFLPCRGLNRGTLEPNAMLTPIDLSQPLNYLPLSTHFESPAEKFAKGFENWMFSVSLNHKAVFTMVQLVTLPSPETE